MMGDGSTLDEVGIYLVPSSPSVSLTRTALRTRNCRLPPRESTQSRLLLRPLSSRGEPRGDYVVDIVYPCCAGLDIHKETVVACVRRHGGQGPARQETRTFGTATHALLALADWLSEQEVTHLAMESTGVYWKPVWNVLEGQ